MIIIIIWRLHFLCLLQTTSLTMALTRKKTETDEPDNEKLKRVLTFFDLTALGTGSTLGCGVYVLAGAVAKSIAGPAVVLSFAIAAVVSAFSGKYNLLLFVWYECCKHKRKDAKFIEFWIFIWIILLLLCIDSLSALNFYDRENKIKKSRIY